MENKLNIVTVIQARSGSSRLPNKIFLPLSNAPLLYRMYERVAASKLRGTIIIATTTDKNDDQVEELCKEYQLNCYRGHPTDLLDRHYQAAKLLTADAVVKIPSDCPLIDPNIIDKVLKFYIDNYDKYDFVSNLHPPTYPDGNDVEIMSFEALKNALENAKLELEREHTTPYFWENPDKFRVGNVVWESGLDYSMSHRFTIDYERDYDFIKQVYDELYPINKKFTLKDILDFLNKKPEIRKINEEYCGVNWYRNHLSELRTITSDQTKIIKEFIMPNKVEFNKDYPSITKSDEYYKVALELIPCTTQTLAKGPQQNVKGVAPKYLQFGKGSHVWDVDGNEYIDYQMAIGPLSLGYAYDKVDEAIKVQLKDGITFSLMHPLEVEVAELIHKVVPNAESIRYSKVGADVTSAAVRLARAFTKRDKVLCCGYHGWHDWYIAVTDRNKGIPQSIQDMTYTINYNDIQSVIDSIDEDTACVILEPYVFEEPKDNFLQKLRDVCTKNGTLLIFDEMWSGFRIAIGGAQEYFGIKADLACFSKAVANGMPISILTGRKDVMSLLEQEVFFFTTFGGEALSLAAAKATINEMIEKNVPAQLAKQGNKLKVGYNKIAEELGMNYTKCSGFDCRTIITFDGNAGNPLEMKSLVQQEMIKRGILWGGFHNMSFSHSDSDIEYTLKVYNEVLPILKKAVEENNVKGYLKGEPVGPVFRKVSNFNMKPKKK